MNFTLTPAFSSWGVNDARFVPVPTAVTPATANGLGPHALTVTGYGWPAGANCSITIKDGPTYAYATVGSSPNGPAAAAGTFTGPVTFLAGTLEGTYQLWLLVNGSAYKGPTFTLTMDVLPTVTDVAPPAGTGLGPHVLTLTGSDFPTAANACQIVLQDATEALVGESPVGTAPDARTFTAPVTFNMGTPSGAYVPWLVVPGAQVPGPAFALTVPPPTVTPASVAPFATPRVLKALRQVLLGNARLRTSVGVFAEAAVPATAPVAGEYLTVGPITEVPHNTMGKGAHWGRELTAAIKVVSYSTDVAPAYALMEQIIALLDAQELPVEGFRTAWAYFEIAQDAYTELVAGVEVRHFPLLFRVQVHES